MNARHALSLAHVALLEDSAAPREPTYRAQLGAINEHLGRRLRRRRRQLGLTQAGLAQTGGVRFQQIQKYECGANAMSAYRLWDLARCLEIPVSYFYLGLAEADGPALETEVASEFIRVVAGLAGPSRRRLLALMQAMGEKADVSGV